MSIKRLWRPELQAALPGTAVDPEDIADKAAAIAGAYDELGLWSDEQRGSASEVICASLGELATAARGLQLEFYIPIKLSRSFGLDALVSAYDNLPAKGVHEKWEAFVATFWDRYSSQDLGAQSSTGARGMLIGGEANKANEPGLYLTNQSFQKQRKAANRMTSRLNKIHELDARTLDPAGWIALNAIRRFEGRPLMDNYTSTIFTGLEPQFIPGNLATYDHYRVPIASTDGEQLLFRSANESKSASRGVRYSLGQKPA